MLELRGRNSETEEDWYCEKTSLDKRNEFGVKHERKQ